MKSILCVALVATLALTNVEAAALPKGNVKPQKDKSSYLKNDTKEKIQGLSNIIRDEGVTGAWKVLKGVAE